MKNTRFLLAAVCVAAGLTALSPVQAGGPTARCDGVMAQSTCPSSARMGSQLPAFGLSSVATPKGDRVIVVGGDGNFGDRLAVACYASATGKQIYSRLISLGHQVRIYASAITNNGRTLVAVGWTYEDSSSYRPLVLALNPANGALLWSRLGADRHRHDYVLGVAVAPDNRHAFVSTALEEQADSFVDDLLVERIDLARGGRTTWQRRLSSSNGLDEYPIATHYAGGHVVVPADVQLGSEDAPEYAYAVYFLDPNTGAFLKRLTHTGQTGDDWLNASAVSIDRRFIAVTGNGPYDEIQGSDTAGTLLFDAKAMRMLWRHSLPMGFYQDEFAYGVAFAGSHVVVGASQGPKEAYSPVPYTYGYVGAGWQPLIYGLNIKDGKQDWLTTVTDGESTASFVNALAASPDGKTVYWNGYSASADLYVYAGPPAGGAVYAEGPADNLMISLDANTGNRKWLNRWNGEANGDGWSYLYAVTATKTGLFASGLQANANPTSGQLNYRYTGAVLHWTLGGSSGR